MVFELYDRSRAGYLFGQTEETFIHSCMQGIMGSIYADDPEDPTSAAACLGDFVFFAGKTEKELLEVIPKGYAIIVPMNEKWEAFIASSFPQAEKITRYATRKDTSFDEKKLLDIKASLPLDYDLSDIDEDTYNLCLNEDFSRDLVSVFGSRKRFLELGKGKVILKNGRVVSGASSYSRYDRGIEIEVDTAEDERRKGLAAICCAALIIDCLKEGLYPSWDAHNRASLHLAEKLGYELDHEYTAFELKEI
ncbi:MAG: GNAT family N-acetyltransferase [Clostridia bacterium]|nr:GNAT family N-acetyltransferase [Clostridia bacterium]